MATRIPTKDSEFLTYINQTADQLKARYRPNISETVVLVPCQSVKNISLNKLNDKGGTRQCSNQRAYPVKGHNS